MATLEQVEKLRQKANVSYDEAKAALDACSDDLLDALIYLERQGRVTPPENGGYYTSRQEPPKDVHQAYTQQEQSEPRGENLGQLFRRFWRWFRKLIRYGNANYFDVWQKEQTLLSVPVTVLAVLMLFCFWIVLPLLLVGLFCGCRYRFRGPDLGKAGVNDVMDSAAKAADNIKNEVMHSKEED